MVLVKSKEARPITEDDRKRVRDYMERLCQLLKKITTKPGNPDHRYGSAQCKTEIVSRAADGSSFECIVSVSIDGGQEIVQRKVVVKSLTALIGSFSSI